MDLVRLTPPPPPPPPATAPAAAAAATSLRIQYPPFYDLHIAIETKRN